MLTPITVCFFFKLVNWGHSARVFQAGAEVHSLLTGEPAWSLAGAALPNHWLSIHHFVLGTAQHYTMPRGSTLLTKVSSSISRSVQQHLPYCLKGLSTSLFTVHPMSSSFPGTTSSVHSQTSWNLLSGSREAPAAPQESRLCSRWGRRGGKQSTSPSASLGCSAHQWNTHPHSSATPVPHRCQQHRHTGSAAIAAHPVLIVCSAVTNLELAKWNINKLVN